MMRVVLLPIIALTLAACDPHALERRQAALAAYVGRAEVDVVRQFGIPTRTFEANGHRFLAYDEIATQIVPAFAPYPWGFADSYPADVVRYVCETTFEVSDGRVSGVSLRGNACG